MKGHPKRERRSKDRPIKRLRQLQARLDLLLHESHALRSASALESAAWPTLDDARDAPEHRGR